MNTMTHSNQLKQLEALQHGLGSVFIPSPVPSQAVQGGLMAAAGWTPRMDISEDDQEYLITTALQEVKKEDVKVTATESALTILGERLFAKEETGRERHCVERAKESFVRRFLLPSDADSAKLSTKFKDGQLTVHLAKKGENPPPPEEVVDEITAWWQKALGKKAVLGQANIIPALGTRTQTRQLVWTKPEGGPAQPASKTVAVPPRTIEQNTVSSPSIQDRKGRLRMERNRTTLERLKDLSGVMVNDAAVYLAILLLRSVGAVVLTIRSALGVS